MRRLLALTLLIPLAAYAESPADRIAPYLTDDAFAVARLDVAGLNAEAAYARLRPFLGTFLLSRDAPPAELPAAMQQAVAAARAVGIREAFYVVGVENFPGDSGYWVVPVPPGADANAIRDFLPLGPNFEKAVGGGAVVAGPKATVARVKAMKKPTARSALAAAFAAAGNGPVQAALVPTADQRHVLREMLPDLPEQYGGATGERLAAGLKWAAAGVSVEPRLSVSLVIQSEDDQAAEALKEAIAGGLRRVSTEPATLKAFPAFPLFVGALIPKREGSRLVLQPDEAVDVAAKMFAAVAGAAGAGVRRDTSVNNLKRILLAFHNFADKYGSFPPAASYDAAGKPLLSWRVHLLPHLDQAPLYAEFRLNEPWDSEHNQKLIARMPEVYRSPTVPTRPGETPYLVPTGDGLTFGGPVGMTFRQITDGTSNTVLVIEATAAQAVPWTKPADLPIDPQAPLAGLTAGRDTFPAAYADGSVHTLKTSLDAATFLKLLTPAGGEVIAPQP